ncbi:MAG: hypothetical protein ACJ76Y_12500 [Thermoanaerobaculia bacterium]
MSKRKVLLLALIGSMALVIPASRASAYGTFYPPFESSGELSNTCAVQCPDGSWSGIGCNSGEIARCTCSGSPVQADPHCMTL